MAFLYCSLPHDPAMVSIARNGIVDAVAKKDVIEEAAEWALSHPPAPISKREVPKTNRCPGSVKPPAP